MNSGFGVWHCFICPKPFDIFYSIFHKVIIVGSHKEECVIPVCIDSYKRGLDIAGIGNFSCNYSMTLNISGSNKDIFENEAPIDSRDFFYFKICIYIFHFDNQFGLRQQIRMFFLNPEFSWNMAISHFGNSAIIIIKN